MTRIWALCLMAAPAVAQAGVCEDLASLRTDYAATPTLVADASCREVLTLADGTQLHCQWPFAYRAPAAEAQFEALVSEVEGCLGAGTENPRDLAVNHPDFYDLRQFTDAAGTIAVSIKDKGGLQQTFVFMRLSPPAAN